MQLPTLQNSRNLKGKHSTEVPPYMMHVYAPGVLVAQARIGEQTNIMFN